MALVLILVKIKSLISILDVHASFEVLFCYRNALQEEYGYTCRD
jgi:hypothetical protein